MLFFNTLFIQKVLKNTCKPIAPFIMPIYNRNAWNIWHIKLKYAECKTFAMTITLFYDETE